MTVRLPALLVALGLTVPAFAETDEWNDVAEPPKKLSVRASAELGFLAVLSHEIQFSRSGTLFDYKREGGQDNLYDFLRFSVDTSFGPRHGLVLLYQPLELRTTVPLKRDVVVDDVTFKQGTVVDHLYSFPFTRASYLYDFDASSENELSLGVSMQLRNARIEFGSRDGTQLRSQRDIGPVPLLKLRARRSLANGWFWGVEADGTYANIKGVNGSNNEVTGALLDTSLRAGFKLAGPGEAFLNLRYLGGGAEGQGDPEPPNDGYTRNWLHFLTLSVGANLDLL